jgi:predicted Rossmann fold nucleotide-binding protein DprA/Smf involved in DNA uptake
MTLRATEDKEHFSQVILRKDYPKLEEDDNTPPLAIWYKLH